MIDEDFLLMACEICFCEYNNTDTIPALFKKCGHSCCSICLHQLASPFYRTAKVKSVNCFVCKKSSDFEISQSTDQKTADRLINFQNKLITESARPQKTRISCNHEKLTKKKYVCLDKECTFFKEQFCSYCRKKSHSNCKQESILKIKDFEKTVILKKNDFGLCKWSEKIRNVIHEKTRILETSLLANISEIEEKIGKKIKDSTNINFEYFMQKYDQFDINFDPKTSEMIISKYEPKELKAVLEQTTNYFEKEFLYNIPLVLTNSLQNSFLNNKVDFSSFLELEDLELKSDFSTIIDHIAKVDSGHLLEYKNEIEKQAKLFQKELNVDMYKIRLIEDYKQSQTDFSKVYQTLQKKITKLRELNKKSHYKMRFTNGDLKYLLKMNNNVFFTPEQFENVIRQKPQMKTNTVFMKNKLSYFLSKVDVEKIKKIMQQWPVFQKQAFFKNMESYKSYFILSKNRKDLMKLNSKVTGFKYSEFQAIESEIYSNRFCQENLLKFGETLEEKEIFDKIMTFLENKAFYQIPFWEFLKVFPKSEFKISYKEFAMNGEFGYYVDSTELSKFFKESEEEFETFLNYNKIYSGMKKEVDKIWEEKQRLKKLQNELILIKNTFQKLN